MASHSTNIQPSAPSLFPSIRSIFAKVGHALVVAGENSSRMKRIEFLRGLNDQELASKGLKREDIVRHVFSDLYYM